MNFNINLSLEDLENNIWGEIPFDSYVVRSAYELRKKPLKDFTGENLRILISQNQSLNYLVPLALDKLVDNIWESGDFYDGCLLVTVLDIESDFWKEHVDLFYELKEIMLMLFSQIETFNDNIFPLWDSMKDII